MKATVTWVGALLISLQAASLSHAQSYRPPVPANYSPVFRVPLPVAPDAMGPGFYTMCPDGTVFGPNYYLQPCVQPFNGMLPGAIGQQIQNSGHSFHNGQGGAPSAPLLTKSAPSAPMAPFAGPDNSVTVYPTHPYARSPRDFFMWGDVMQDRVTRDLRPVTAP